MTKRKTKSKDVAKLSQTCKEVLAIYNSETPPPMPKKLPKLIKLLTSKVDDMYKPAVAMSVFPALGAHLKGVTFTYVNNVTYPCGGFMQVLMAKSSIGKGAVNKPIESVLADIRERDAYWRGIEDEYRSQCRRSKSNEKKPQRPEGIVVQCMMSNMTNAALVQRLIDAERAGGCYLYTRLNEIELLNQIRQSGGATPSEVIRIAMDQDQYGAERVSSEGVVGTPTLRFNFNASTTIEGGQTFLKKHLHNGTLGRICLCTIIRPDDDIDIPMFGTYDEAFEKELKPYITRLNAATGEIESAGAHAMTQALLEENKTVVKETDDDDFLTLSFRSTWYAHNRAIVLQIAEGEWSKEIGEFCRWSMEYDLWCKCRYFSELMLITHQVVLSKTPGPRNMLNDLPMRFKAVDLERLRKSKGKDGTVNYLIAMWINRGYIERDPATEEYVKTQQWLNKHPQ